MESAIITAVVNIIVIASGAGAMINFKNSAIKRFEAIENQITNIYNHLLNKKT